MPSEDTQFKVGNQISVGNKGGAPRTVSPGKEDCIALGKELVEWAKVEDENNPHLLFGEWYSLIKGILRKEWKTLVQASDFLPYYEKAQKILSKRCIDGTMEKSFGHRYLRYYDRELTEDENELLKLKSDLIKNENEAKENATEIKEAMEELAATKARNAELEALLAKN